MAAGYNHPKVKVHVGDGFKFLDDYKNTFDVIITDSSDPEGPAESLFQKPYFQLMHDALREGGVITTQGCRFSLIMDCQLRALGTAFSMVSNMPTLQSRPLRSRAPVIAVDSSTAIAVYLGYVFRRGSCLYGRLFCLSRSPLALGT